MVPKLLLQACEEERIRTEEREIAMRADRLRHGSTECSVVPRLVLQACEGERVRKGETTHHKEADMGIDDSVAGRGHGRRWCAKGAG